jgi:two-component system response regulator FixJ
MSTLPVSSSSPREPALVCIIDDEPAVRNLAEKILTLHGYRVQGYSSAKDFFAKFDEAATSCVITDLRMPEVDGLELQRRLKERGCTASIIVLSGFADVKSTVRAMEEGALTLLEKPYSPDELTTAVDRAVALTRSRRTEEANVSAVRVRLKQLTPDEVDVLNCMITGIPNKAIASQLNLSMRTVDRRRQAVLMKMDVSSPAELAALMAQLKREGS